LSLVEALFFVGIGWAARVHAVYVLDGSGQKVTEFTIEHTAAGFTKLADRLGKLAADAGSVPIAIERTDGRLVDALLEAGHPVVRSSLTRSRTPIPFNSAKACPIAQGFGVPHLF
jgi:hypothetical protein